MPDPELTVVAAGSTPSGERWYLSAGGSPDDYYTMLKIVHPDGHWGEGGMGGPALYAGHLLNSYAGRGDGGPLRFIARTDPRVRRLRLRSARGELCDLLPAASDPAAGVTFFAAVLPWVTGITSVQGLDADGQLLAD